MSHPVDYDIKGNWLMFKNYCQHLGCCEHCSDTYKINILGNVKCYTKDELYLDDNEMVKFKNGGLTLHQIKHKYEKIVNFKDVKIYKPINIVRNGIMAYNGTTKVMLAVNNFDLSISWLMTTGSFIPVRNDVLEYAGRLIPIKDIQYAVILDDEVSHAYTKTERICFVEHSISKHYRNIENELVPWILTGSTLMHTLGCSCRKIDLFIKKDIKLIKFDDYSAIIEYTENEKTVKSVIDLVHNTRRYKFVETITPDNEHKTTDVVKNRDSLESCFDVFMKDPRITELISKYTEKERVKNYVKLLWETGADINSICAALGGMCKGFK